MSMMLHLGHCGWVGERKNPRWAVTVGTASRGKIAQLTSTQERGKLVS